jgi:SAM-dependent methyltransferase
MWSRLAANGSAPRKAPPYPARSRYVGAVASGYVGRRAVTPKWTREQEVIEAVVRTLPAGSRVLDVPVGTGRFLPAYADAGHRVCGIDISADMLAQARAVPAALPRLALVQGEVERLPLRDRAVDWVVCVRFLNWVPAAQLDRIVRELLRVARAGVVLLVRVARSLTAREVVARILRRGLWRDPRRLARRLRRAAGALAARLGGARADYVVQREDALAAALAAAGVETVAARTIGRRLWPLRRRADELTLYVVRRPGDAPPEVSA